ncbi:protein of unknown function [Bradyrhizobium vignae]|uniref:Uncharacterized protein n=1 Tax=Bradyrhizobium vignae TaxID=1549949 RepID=A0A2U3QA82_9BRAD|nr:protein of unknown function [Bradyrhizobium vignae]
MRKEWTGCHRFSALARTSPELPPATREGAEEFLLAAAVMDFSAGETKQSLLTDGSFSGAGLIALRLRASGSALRRHDGPLQHIITPS